MSNPKPIIFQSIFAFQMHQFVKIRQLSGSDYTSQARLLWHFDQFLVQENFTKLELNAFIYQAYLSHCTHLNQRSLGNNISVIRQFCLYLNQAGNTLFLPEPVTINRHYEVYTPTIFTQQEIKQLLQQAKILPPCHSPIRAHTFYTLLGLLYTTGIRIGEALALNVNDYSRQRQRLHIRRGKFHKERWLALTESTCHVLNDYLKERTRWATLTEHPPFFISLRKNRLSQSAATVAFKSVLKQSLKGKKIKAHLHDIRHTFAVHRLTLWYQQGVDINAHLPALATHMGHVSIRSTQIYLHTTPELLALVNANFHKWFQQQVINGDKK
jgi:site-specific recombinase XerD